MLFNRCFNNSKDGVEEKVIIASINNDNRDVNININN